MDGCECVALDDATHSFCFGKMPSIWPAQVVFVLLGYLGAIFHG